MSVRIVAEKVSVYLCLSLGRKKDIYREVF
jgi:hypothetical protein